MSEIVGFCNETRRLSVSQAVVYCFAERNNQTTKGQIVALDRAM